MTIYQLCYPADGTRDGYHYEFFTSRAAAGHARAAARREYAQDHKAHDEFEGDFYDCPPAPSYDPRDADITELHFLGTPREMVLQALRYRS